jgi:hypothetical protein
LFGFRPVHDQDVKKSFVAAVLLSTITLRAVAVLVDDFVGSMGNAAVTSECVAEPDTPCDPFGRESPPDGTVWGPASQDEPEFEKWAVLLLEVGAAGWVLLRSGREAKTRRSTRFALRPTAPQSEFDETAIDFRTL